MVELYIKFILKTTHSHKLVYDMTADNSNFLTVSHAMSCHCKNGQKNDAQLAE